VLVGLFAAPGECSEVRVLLTRRAASLSTHAGEVAFPGGRADAAEPPLDAALREAREEVGLERAAVQRVLGSLAPVTTARATALVVPVVAVLSGLPVLRPNPSEVARAFDVSLASLAGPGVFREERWPMPGGGDRSIDFFEVAGETIWGATARILRALLVAVLGPPEVGPEGDRRTGVRRDAGSAGTPPGRASAGATPDAAEQRDAVARGGCSG
jgi:8-oxo-dGTP pyrophosphatase MutT (NUDIX family)